jgi:exopolyphosphatase/guanosine-5'-triphosphate,3'-diphosphate pyrophosphatase
MKILGAIDIGTNAIRLEVVRIESDHSLTTLSQQKETVRLGEGEFTTHRMTPAAIERGALVCARFADMARGFGADEIIAVATSAAREAENQADFLERVQEEAGLEVQVISGPEEARLIYLGVSSGANLGERRALFIDIGGGSTELILGDAKGYFMLESLKLGAIRIANVFLQGERGAISSDKVSKMKEYVRGIASHTARSLRNYGFDVLYGSAGTITNLGDITARRLGDTPATLLNYPVKLPDLQASVDILCKLSLEERRKLPGLDPDRADIIAGGAVVLLTIMEELKAEGVVISDRGLRDGIIVDRLMREDDARMEYTSIPVRKRSILQLARSCNYDVTHAEHITALALGIFDEMRRLGFHPYGSRERELLEYAGYVHDIGCFLSHTNHQRHSYYLIRNSDLLGFSDAEISIIANIALYHRKGMPKKRHENMQNLTRQSRHLVRVLSAMMRIAEGLDRSHLGLVQAVRVEPAKNPERLILTLISEADCQLEIWWVETNKELFETVFGFPLSVIVRHPDNSETASPE